MSEAGEDGDAFPSTKLGGHPPCFKNKVTQISGSGCGGVTCGAVCVVGARQHLTICREVQYDLGVLSLLQEVAQPILL